MMVFGAFDYSGCSNSLGFGERCHFLGHHAAGLGCPRALCVARRIMRSAMTLCASQLSRAA